MLRPVGSLHRRNGRRQRFEQIAVGNVRLRNTIEPAGRAVNDLSLRRRVIYQNFVRRRGACDCSENKCRGQYKQHKKQYQFFHASLLTQKEVLNIALTEFIIIGRWWFVKHLSVKQRFCTNILVKRSAHTNILVRRHAHTNILVKQRLHTNILVKPRAYTNILVRRCAYTNIFLL